MGNEKKIRDELAVRAQVVEGALSEQRRVHAVQTEGGGEVSLPKTLRE